MYPHRIRLRGPWEAESLEPPGEARRVTLPARFSDCGFEGCRSVRFRRRFGRPRQIDAEERVWLIGEGLSGQAVLSVNEHHLGAHAGTSGPFTFPVTDLLRERNVLSIDVTATGPNGGLWGDVALEIRRRAWLGDIRAEPAEDGRWRVRGEIAGTAEGPMDVYVLADNRSVGYQSVAAGERFDLSTDELADAPGALRVELVGGAVVWYVAEVPLRRERL